MFSFHILYCVDFLGNSKMAIARFINGLKNKLKNQLIFYLDILLRMYLMELWFGITYELSLKNYRDYQYLNTANIKPLKAKYGFKKFSKVIIIVLASKHKNRYRKTYTGPNKIKKWNKLNSQ